MTEGIIQQVFKRILDRNKLKDADREQLIILQQELIEKIKKEFKPEISCGCDVCSTSIYYYKKLVGDNK